VSCSEVGIRCRNWVGCSELTFATELCVLQQIWDSLPKLYCLQRICNLLPNCVSCSEVGIRCWCCIVCSEFPIRCQNWVDCSELTFAIELCVLQWIWGTLPKLYWLQRFFNSLSNCVSCSEVGIRCRSCIVYREFKICCQNWVDCSELTFATELCVLQRIWDSLPKLYWLQWIFNSLPNCVSCNEVGIRCQSCIVCSELEIRCWNWVDSSKLAFGAELCVLQRIWDSLPKLSWLQRINIHCRILCPAANLGFPAAIVLPAANL